jgi:hypothetical protein
MNSYHVRHDQSLLVDFSWSIAELAVDNLMACLSASLQWFLSRTCSNEDFIHMMDSLEMCMTKEMQNEETWLVTSPPVPQADSMEIMVNWITNSLCDRQWNKCQDTTLPEMLLSNHHESEMSRESSNSISLLLRVLRRKFPISETYVSPDRANVIRGNRIYE